LKDLQVAFNAANSLLIIKLEITPDRFFDETELTFEYIKATGPGGQNINKVSSAVRLRYNFIKSEFLNTKEKDRLRKIAAHRVTEDGYLLIEAHRFRTQIQNRADVINRFVSLINTAIRFPRIRIRTHPSRIARATRQIEKKKHGTIKRLRSNIPNDWE